MTSALRRAPQPSHAPQWTPLDQALHRAELKFHEAKVPLLQLCRLAELERLNGGLSPAAERVRRDLADELVRLSELGFIVPEEPTQ